MEQIIKIGARGSPLSLAQTGALRAELAVALGIETNEIETRLCIIPITTQGDKIQDRALLEAGGKGLFTKELDDALLDGRIDCAVHSMKDVPTQLPNGITLLGCPMREDRRDALITKSGLSFDELPHGALIGTASLRRSAQFLRARPDLKISLLRGNVGTRLARVENGDFDATILAIAGLKRIGLFDENRHIPIDPCVMPPAIAQGALAITARANDIRIAQIFEKITDKITSLEVTAERAFLRALDGSCRTAIAANCQIIGETMQFFGEKLSDDGREKYASNGEAIIKTINAAEDFGQKMAHNILMAE